MGNYQVLFSGEVSQQANKDAVRENLARELGIDNRKAKQLFSGRTVVIKSQLKHDDALELQQLLGEFGAVCRVKDLTPKNNDIAIYGVDDSCTRDPQATLRDITAAHSECPRCGHMQLEASHCARCGVDLGAAARQKHKEDFIIEKKIRELRSNSDDSKVASSASIKAGRRGHGTARKPRKGGWLMSWFRKSS